MTKMKKVLVIGGGSGAAAVLERLKDYALEITSACTPFDNGGHSGELRLVDGVLPPGDSRRHIIARSREGGFLRKLLAHRFKSNGLQGKSLGNLMALAARDECGGDDQAGLDHLAQAFGVVGRILYTTTDEAHLCAELSDGEILVGEEKIDLRPHTDKRTIKRIFLDRKAYIQRDMRQAITMADVIICAPGDTYGSVGANTLVEGFKEAMQETQAKLVNVTNIVTKANETFGFKASHFSRVLLSYIGRDQFDAVLCNTARIEERLLALYAAENAHPVEVDVVELQQVTKKIVTGDFVQQSDIVRHHPVKLAKALMEVIHGD